MKFEIRFYILMCLLILLMVFGFIVNVNDNLIMITILLSYFSFWFGASDKGETR